MLVTTATATTLVVVNTMFQDDFKAKMTPDGDKIERYKKHKACNQIPLTSNSADAKKPDEDRLRILRICYIK